MSVQGPFVGDRYRQVLCQGLLRDVGIRSCGQVDPSRRKAKASRRSRNDGWYLPWIREARRRQPTDERRARKRCIAASRAGCVVAGDHLIEEATASPQYPAAIPHRLPGKSDSRSEVVIRCAVLNDIIDRVAIDAVRGRALVVGRDNISGQTASRSSRS